MSKIEIRREQDGFTFLELLVVIAMVGILAAIVAPAWLRFLAEQQTTRERGHVRLNIQTAQLNAQQQNVSWQASIRQNGSVLETATHPSSTLPTNWDKLSSSVQLDVAETTLLETGGIYYVRFNEKGNVRNSTLGRVTVSSKQFPYIKRCVFVSTLIGATRVSEEQQRPDSSGRICH